LAQYERRYTDRYPLPGAKVQYNLDGGNSDETSVKDITQGGLCFEFSHNADEGHRIEIELKIPGMDNLVLKGHIVWTSVSSGNDPNLAAMQFLPFGTDNRYNSMDNHERLKKVLQECLKNNPPNIKFRL
jgi:hypothetical protein